MGKFVLRFLLFFVFVASFVTANLINYESEIFAACENPCTTSNDCNTCCEESGASTGSCSESCLTRNVPPYDKRCVITQENTTPPQCSRWCSWSACSGGYRTRDCCDGVSNEYQIEACGTPTSGGGSGGCTVGTWTSRGCGGGGCSSDLMYQTRTVSPSGCDTTSRCIASSTCEPPPTTATSCSASAVLSPNNPTVALGSSVTFTLTVSDSPSGCVDSASFTRSNTNASITSTNPDPSRPFTVTARCDANGTVTVSGYARSAGVTKASDSVTVTCGTTQCTLGTWQNGTCGGGGCASTQRLQTRTVSPAGCDTTTRCISDSTCSVPPGCTTGSWTNRTCGGGTCAADQMQQTRTVSPSGCAATSQCISDPSCGGSCTAGTWQDSVCGGGSCTSGQMLQTRTVNPPGCTSSTRCVSSTDCAPPPPGCTTGSWTNNVCGGGACDPDEMRQTRTTNPPGCTSTSQCVPSSLCTTPSTCTTTAWTDTTCGSSPCTAGEMRQTRTVNPGGCASTVRCVARADCSLPPVGCTTGAWSSTTCGGSFCDADEMHQVRAVSPAGCALDEQCVPNAACAPPPTCNTGLWQNASCGGGSCAITQMYQTRTVSPAGCAPTSRCVSAAACNIPVCSAPAPRDPPTATCGDPGQVTWEWNAVANVNQYNLVIERLVSGTWSVVSDDGWQSSATYGCAGGGICRKTETRAIGEYRSRVRARNTNVTVCTTSAFRTSQPVRVYGCAVLELQDIILFGVGARQTVIPRTEYINSTMNFLVNPPVIASFNPASDTPAYQTEITSTDIGSSTYTARATDGGGNPIEDTGSLEVINPPPWCQVKEGEMIAGGVFPAGNISCPIPAVCQLNPGCNPSLIIADPGESVGVVVAGGSVDDGSGLSDPAVSPNMTLENADYDGTVYNYAYFLNKVGGSSVTNISSISQSSLLGVPVGSGGYRWALMNSCPASIGSPINLGNEKVVLFVRCSLNINAPITLNDGRGFFIAIVNGDINVSGDVGGAFDATPDLEGIYYADGGFFSENPAVDPDQTLQVRGVVSADSFNLNRDLPDNSATPAEFFEFGADQVLQLPTQLSRKQVIWKEVAP